jgi:hypothetical protein
MAPAPSGRPPILPPHPKSPRTLPIDDFIQISDAAKGIAGEGVITDLQSFMDATGYTSTSGSFRVTAGSVELASIPRQSINGQVNVYVGAVGERVIDKHLPGTTVGMASPSVGVSFPELNETPGISPRSSGSSDILIKTSPDDVVEGRYMFNRQATVLSHEIGHAIDFAGESITGSQLTSLKRASDKSSDILDNVKELKRLIDSGMDQEEALNQSGVRQSVFSYARGYGESEALADTSAVSSYRRLAENNPELARKMGLDDTGDFTMFGETRQRTLSLDVVDRFSGNRMGVETASQSVPQQEVNMKIGSGYTLGKFDDSMMQGRVDVAAQLRSAGVSDDLIEELSEQSKVVSAATYAARVGGFEEGSEELEILGKSARARGKVSLSGANYDEQIQSAQEELAAAETDMQRAGKYAGEKSRERVEKARQKVERFETLRERNSRLYDEVFEEEIVKGRYNIDVVDDVSEIVSEAKEEVIRPRLDALSDQEPRASVSARVSTAVDASLDDAAESVARRIPPQPVLEVGSGKASRKTLQRIVESGMTAKRVARTIL